MEIYEYQSILVVTHYLVTSVVGRNVLPKIWKYVNTSHALLSRIPQAGNILICLHLFVTQVVTEPTEWKGGLVGINSFGFGGSNVHVILKSPNIPQNKSLNEDHQVCVPISGRNEEAVNKFIELANKNQDNEGLLSLLGDISATSTNTFQYRGYTIVGCEGKVQEVAKVKNGGRPVWFVCSGMGTQWNGMGQKMMKIPLFKQSVCNSSKYLKEYGFDLEKMILDTNEDTYKNTINSFVGLAAIQIALIDCLKALGKKQLVFHYMQ